MFPQLPRDHASHLGSPVCRNTAALHALKKFPGDNIIGTWRMSEGHAAGVGKPEGLGFYNLHPPTIAKELIGSPESLSPAKAINEWGWEDLSIFFCGDRVYIQKGIIYHPKINWSISIHSSHRSRWDALAVPRWSFSHSPSCCNLKRIRIRSIDECAHDRGCWRLSEEKQKSFTN